MGKRHDRREISRRPLAARSTSPSTSEKVWQALTTGRVQPAIFFRLCDRGRSEVGGAFIARAPDGSEHIRGEVIECDPPKRLTVTWNVNWPALVEKLGPTLVTYEIEKRATP